MLNILVFAPNLNGGGAERVLVNYLNNLNFNQFKVTLVLVSKEGALLELVPEEVQIIDLKKEKTVFCLFSLRRLIYEISPDIVYSTLIRTSIVLALAVVFYKKKPKIFMRSPNSPKLLKENKQISIIQEKLVKYAYRISDKVIAQTEEMKNEIHHIYGTRLDKITVVLNPIDKLMIDNLSVMDLEDKFDIRKINVVASGRLIRQKGFDTLIKCFELVVKAEPKYHLHIIGEDVAGELSSYKELIKKLKLESNISFHGFQKNPYNFYKNADVYVLSSRWEGLPNTVLENLYLKKPIVATRCIPFMEQVISDGKNGWLVEVDNIVEMSTAILKYGELSHGNEKKSVCDYDLNELFSKGISNE